MLHMRLLSGQVVASMPVEQVSSVKEVKRRLHQLHGLPPRFRQRLILHGTNLDDADMLDTPLDLEIVLQDFAIASQAQECELVAAATNGSLEEADVF